MIAVTIVGLIALLGMAALILSGRNPERYLWSLVLLALIAGVLLGMASAEWTVVVR